MVAVYFLYSTLLAAVFLLGSPYWLVQMARLGKYRAGLRERFGAVPDRVLTTRGRTVWIHAVSVGEVLAISKLVEELRRQYPRVLISTTTHTGQKLARERFGPNNVFYFPLDFSFAVRSYMRRLKPELVVVAETEFWPNFLRAAKESGARVAVANARISDRSLPRYLKFRDWMTRILRDVDLFLAQSDEDARRLVEIGAETDRVHVSGNLKFEVPAGTDVPFVRELRDAIVGAGASPVMVAGSTVEGEEEIVLTGFAEALKNYPSGLLVLAPRHKERFQTIAEMLAESGISWTRRSQWRATSHELAGSVLLLDSIGELAGLYSLADVAFVGGSLVPRGGHNILEPAQAAIPIIVGPHMENFRDILAIFTRAKAVQVAHAKEFAATLLALLDNDQQRTTLGERAIDVLRSQAGATERTVSELGRLVAKPVVQR
jgi:3-deoxy-D-manno-octulosonic-acid transferase